MSRHFTTTVTVRGAAVMLLVALAAMGTRPTPAHAATITVTTPADVVAVDGQCSLREAVTNANDDLATNADCAAGTGVDTITFSVGGTITLAGRLVITDADGLVMDGTSQAVTLSGNNANGIFFVAMGGALEVRRLTLEAGSAASGGAVEAQASTLTVVDSVIRANTATTTGGGIRVVGATLTVTGSTISGNSGGHAGGGISIEGATTATIANTTISGNTVTLINAQGGGVLVGGGATATLRNVTISANSALNGGAGGNGGGIRNLGTVNMANSVVAGNTASLSGPDCTGGGAISQGNNLIGDTTDCGFVAAAGDVTDVDARLGALAANGGYSQTHALLGGSPALDAGSNAMCAAAPVAGVDQRGTSRPQNGTCDMGAYEHIYAPLPTPPSTTDVSVPGAGTLTLEPWSGRTAGPGESLLLVQGPAGPLTFTLPAGWAGTQVTVGLVSPSALAPLLAGPPALPGSILAFVLDGSPTTTADAPAVTFEVDLPAGAEASDLALGYWDGTAWQPLPLTVTAVAGPRVRVQATLPSAGVFGLFDAPETRVDLSAGVNLVTWSGRGVSVADALAAAPEGMVALIARYDPAAQVWQVHIPGAPAHVNSLQDLRAGDILFIRSGAGGTWVVPPW